jgi:protein-S-isoprenylcysteine O-methyltransferase Ste14
MFAKLRMFLSEKRILISRIFCVFLALLLLISRSSWDRNTFMDSMLEFMGLMLVCVGMLGRIWTALYISGYKCDTLVTKGPYSIVRNPLYFFSFLGAAGIGLSSESLLMTMLICLLFLLYYPFVVLHEEKQLASRHVIEFQQYASVTPRFVPNFFLYDQPESYTVSVKQYQKSFLDASMFILIYAILQLLERLHESGILPTYLRIP